MSATPARPLPPAVRDKLGRLLPMLSSQWLIANRAPERALRTIQKSPVGAGSLEDVGDSGIAIGEWTNAARTSSAFYRILGDSGFTRLPVNTRIGISVAPATGVVTAEGHAIPMSPLQLTNVMLSPIKASALLVVSDELLRDVSSPGQTALNRALMGAVSDAVDGAFLDLIVNTGTTSITSSGATAVNAKADLRSDAANVS